MLRELLLSYPRLFSTIQLACAARRLNRWALVVTLTLVASQATAGSLYLPVKLSPEIESAVERLFVAADMPLIKRPIPVKLVQLAITKAADKDPQLANSVGRYLERYAEQAGSTHSSLRVSLNDGVDAILPNERGFSTDSSYVVSSAGYLVLNDYIALNLGAVAGDRSFGDDLYLEGTFASLGWDAFQVDLGWRSHWWGPTQEGAMLLSSQAPAMPGITLSNVEPFKLLGFSYELFMVQMSESDKIESAANPSVKVTGKPRAFGVMLAVQPFDGFAAAFNRILQYGGGDRPDGLGDVFDAYFSPRKEDNVGVVGKDFGNQVTSFTTSFTFPGKKPFSIYMEYAGEDSSAPTKQHLGNTALTFGIHLPYLTKNLDLSYEYTDWQNGWYTNANYGDGLTNEGVLIGHWALTTRELQPSVPGKAHWLGAIWTTESGNTLSLDYRHVEHNNLDGVYDFDPIDQLQLEYARAFGALIGGVTLTTGNDAWGDSYSQISGFIRW
ncbi:capsule assembly Wzi family protein [Halioxenophilus sp. WMMB6]|uniref:capsule assembly Wzi family protein n=1 Tax=Halioxenophilus sp. WMMB6 TaxID=3073815 RepID=UPI00295E8AA3|nr:capsule assembly Wzi family protein [Halioxenophilus sp. WMMB6]